MEVTDGAGPTIYDVARAAGVAPSTVSRALSKPGPGPGMVARGDERLSAGVGGGPEGMRTRRSG